jgi:hypothetical protein
MATAESLLRATRQSWKIQVASRTAISEIQPTPVFEPVGRRKPVSGGTGGCLLEIFIAEVDSLKKKRLVAAIKA